MKRSYANKWAFNRTLTNSKIYLELTIILLLLTIIHFGIDSVGMGYLIMVSGLWDAPGMPCLMLSVQNGADLPET